MADCELLQGCIFFNDRMAKMPSTTSMMKNKYCLGDNSKCARFTVFQKLGKPQVPTDLSPSDMERADRLIASMPAPPAE
jgi:hypothetical protein